MDSTVGEGRELVAGGVKALGPGISTGFVSSAGKSSPSPAVQVLEELVLEPHPRRIFMARSRLLAMFAMQEEVPPRDVEDNGITMPHSGVTLQLFTSPDTSS
jgi:hypothetical protein